MDSQIIAVAIPLFFLLIGLELVVSRQQGISVYRFNDAITDLSCGIGQQVTDVFGHIITFGLYVVVYTHFRFMALDGADPLTWILAFLGVDLLYYWWHRFTHEVNVGWVTHVVHHQSEDYNLAVALRQSITSSWTSMFFYVPLALLGIPPVIYGTMVAVSTLYQFWIHTETIRSLGPLEWLLNTPSHHRVHHATNPQYLDKNYGAILIIWDRMFASFEPENEPAVYGTVEPLESFNPLWANLWYAVKVARVSARAQHYSDSLRVWIKHPGWQPPGTVAPPPRPTPGGKYDPTSPRGLQAYVIAHFIPTSAATSYLLWVASGATAGTLVGSVALILATTVVWGGLFERRPWAVEAEHARLLCVGLALSAASFPHPTWWPWTALTWIGLGLSAVWFDRYRSWLRNAPRPA